jgi:energy-coupling factor transporter ATP-binding protein EcfA2
MAEILEDERFLGLRKANIGETRGRSGANRRANTSFFLRCRNRSTASQSYFYTENSFSLGELFTLNMVFQIRNIPEGSLLLVDELEVALHPRVQYKLLKFLEKIALERNLTILVSTHSSSLIKSANNLIFLEKDDSGLTNVVYNCYPTYALREVAILEDITPDYVFYVEDVMAERYLRQLIQKYFQLTQQSVMPLWKVMPIGGYPEVLKFGKKSKDYLLPDFIGQYLFLDQDVVFNKEELRAKGNARSLKEQMLWQLFQELDLRTRYLYITPELGLFEWIITSTADLSTRITNDYPDRIIDLREVLAQCSAAFPQTANNLREAAKNKLSWLAKELGGQLGLTLDRFYDEIFKFYCADVLSRPIKQGELRALFGPIFNRRGNPS